MTFLQRLSRATAWALALGLGSSATGLAHDAAQVLGEVHFKTSCSAQAQKAFDRGMAMQHSFWYEAAYAVFEGVLKEDANCAIAHWGMALSLLTNPFSPPTPKNLAAGALHIEQGLAVASGSPRERDYLAALATFYRDHDKIPHRPRVLAYAQAMDALAEKHGEDSEAQIQYALALTVAASPDDKTFANQLKAAAILEAEFKRQPNHPGAAHYLIHAYDYPAIANRGLDAAKRYAKIAPAAPHALHMPSHIFTRLGHWQDSVESNLASAKAARTDKDPNGQLHAQDYVVYAYLQTGQDAKAQATVAEMTAMPVEPSWRNAAHFGLAAALARYALERGAWSEAAALAPRASPYGYADALTHYAVGIGAARTGNPALAREQAKVLAQLGDKLLEAKDRYWSEQVDIQKTSVLAWAAFAEGKRAEGIELMQQAAKAEDATDKHPITPGPLAPARELLGEMLIEAAKPTEALAAFEATLAKEPGRFRAIHGAARAAELAGEKAKAKAHYAALVRIAAAESERPEVRMARAFLAAN